MYAQNKPTLFPHYDPLIDAKTPIQTLIDEIKNFAAELCGVDICEKSAGIAEDVKCTAMKFWLSLSWFESRRGSLK